MGKMRSTTAPQLGCQPRSTLKEALVLIEAGRRHYNAVRTRCALEWIPLAPENIVLSAWPLRVIGKLEAETAMI